MCSNKVASVTHNSSGLVNDISGLGVCENSAANHSSYLKKTVGDSVANHSSYVTKSVGNLVAKDSGLRVCDIPVGAAVYDTAPNIIAPVETRIHNLLQFWSSLFKGKSSKADSYVPIKFNVNFADGAMVSHKEVVDAGMDFWMDHFVSLFLHANLSYYTVKNHLICVWKLRGSVKEKYDKFMYFF